MTLRLVRGLDRSRFAPEISFLDGYGPITDHFQKMGVLVHDLSGPGGPVGAMQRLLSLLERSRFDIVHLYGFRMSLLGRVAARFVSPRPIVVHGIRGLHVTEGEEVNRPRTRVAIAVERLGAPLVDAYIANSHGAVIFLSMQGIPTEKFFVIPNGIDPIEWYAPTRRPAPQIPTIICVANFRPVKRHCDLIESIGLLHKRGVQVRCKLVGDGVTRQETEALVRQRNLNGVVEFTGSRTPREVQASLHASDIFVLPSLWEGMPGSVMEAMATGLPVVGTNVAGIQELVVDGITGYLVPAKDPYALATRLQQLLEDSALRMQMGEAGRRRIQEEFLLENLVRRHEEAYTSLCKARGIAF